MKANLNYRRLLFFVLTLVIATIFVNGYVYSTRPISIFLFFFVNVHRNRKVFYADKIFALSYPELDVMLI